MFCGDRGGCVANRFDTNWIENIGNWQNDLTVSFQPTLINEVLTYQFNPQNQVKVGVYKVLDSFPFLYPIIDEGARSDAGDVRGNLMYENRINGKTFSLINSFSQALYQDRELGNFFQYSATLNYVYAGFEVILNATLRPFTDIEESKYNATLTINYFPSANIKKLTDKLEDHMIILEYRSSTTGKPIKNVRVSVAMNGKIYKAKTNSQGVAEIDGVDQEGDITITASGYSYGSKFKSQLDFSKSASVPVLEELIYVKDSVSIPVKIYLDVDGSGNITNQDNLVNINLTDTLTGEALLNCGNAALNNFGFTMSLGYKCKVSVNDIMLPSRYRVIKLFPPMIDAKKTKIVTLLLRRQE